MEYIPIDWRLDLMSNFMQSDGPLSTSTIGVYLEPYATVTHSVDISLEPRRHGLLLGWEIESIPSMYQQCNVGVDS